VNEDTGNVTKTRKGVVQGKRQKPITKRTENGEGGKKHIAETSSGTGLATQLPKKDEETTGITKTY